MIWIISLGSKEEMIFFDSRGWLDSDCDDDFMSVDGGTFCLVYRLSYIYKINNEFFRANLI